VRRAHRQAGAAAALDDAPARALLELLERLPAAAAAAGAAAPRACVLAAALASCHLRRRFGSPSRAQRTGDVERRGSGMQAGTSFA
jgi:hypothetical protein